MPRVDSSDADQRIPITFLTGFLGAGKTTLVNRILSDPASGKIAVIVNEFGDIAIDGELIASADDDMLELTTGCICCAAKDDLVAALNRLFLRKVGLLEPKIEFTRVLIETTGVADPTPLAQLFYTDVKLDLSFRIDAIVTVVDLKHIVRDLDRAPEARKQLAIADKLVLNKRDLVDQAAFDQAMRLVRALNPLAEAEVTRFGDVPAARLVGLDLFDPKHNDDAVGTWIAAGRTPEPAHAHHEEVGAICLEESRAIEWNRLLEFLWRLTQSYGPDLYRVKGLVRFANVERPVILQGVHEVFSPPTYAARWPRGVPETRLVIIGKGLDRAAIAKGFAACVAPEAEALDRSLGAI